MTKPNAILRVVGIDAKAAALKLGHALGHTWEPTYERSIKQVKGWPPDLEAEVTHMIFYTNHGGISWVRQTRLVDYLPTESYTLVNSLSHLRAYLAAAHG